LKLRYLSCYTQYANEGYNRVRKSPQNTFSIEYMTVFFPIIRHSSVNLRYCLLVIFVFAARATAAYCSYLNIYYIVYTQYKKPSHVVFQWPVGCRLRSVVLYNYNILYYIPYKKWHIIIIILLYDSYKSALRFSDQIFFNNTQYNHTSYRYT